MTDVLRFVFLELGRFNKQISKLETPFEKWIYLLELTTLKDTFFRTITTVNHYYHMAMNHDKRYLEKRGCELKRFMYHMRGLLAAKWAATYETYPPVLFDELVEKMVPDQKIRDEIARMVALKRESREHNTAIVSDELISFAARTAEEIESMFGTFPDEKPQDYDSLNNFFLNILTTFDI